MNFDISAMKLRAKSLVKQCGMTPALIEAMLWGLRVIAVMCGSLSTQNGSIGGYIISGVTTLLLIFLPVGSEWYTLNVAREETPEFQSVLSILQVLCKYKIVQKNLFKWTELNSVRFYVIRKISTCQ